MEKKFKATLKYKASAQRYQVVQIVGPEAVVPIRGPSSVRIGDWLSEAQTKILGERALLTTK